MGRIFRFVFLSLDGLLLALFAVGYLARYIHPRYFWWAELVAVGLPYLSVGLLLATAVVTLLRLWRLLGVHLFLLVLAFLRFVPLGSVFSSAEPSGDELTLMTYNVPRWWGYHTEEKARQMLALMRAEEPDLLVLQDAAMQQVPESPGVKGARYLTDLVDSLGYQFKRNEVGRPSFTPQPVLSRFEPAEQTETVFRIHPGEQDVTRVVRVRFTWKGREAVLYNLHLRTYGREKPWHAEDMALFDPRFWLPFLRQYREAYLVRAWEAEQIRKMLEQETLPIIVAGDLNSTPHNWVYHHLAGALGLRDAFKVAGIGWGATYHNRLPFARIDFVLASPAWEVVSARVAEAWLSDHRPLIVDLRWGD